MIAAAVYLLCALTAAGCAFLTLRGWRVARSPLLFYCGLCFVGLTLNNIVLVVDRLVLKDVDLWPLRIAPALLGVSALIYGLIWRSD